MSKTTETAVDDICLSDEALHDIVNSLGKALRPQVFNSPDQHQMTEGALKTSQSHVQAALRVQSEIT